MRKLASFVLCVFAFAATGCGHIVQQTVLLNKMRAQYYDMHAAGAKAFDCTAMPDWPLFISSATTGTASSSALSDTPWHRYLQGVTLYFRAPLTGAATVTWNEKAPPPADKADAAHQLQHAFRSMLEGFITAWRPNLTNTLLPAIPISEIKSTATGYTLTEKDLEGRASDVTLDASMQVTHLSVHGPNLAVESDTKYVHSPNGLLLVELDSAVKRPDGSTENSVMKSTYAEVDGFQVPASFEVETDRTKVMMNFTGCRVER